MTWRGGGGGTDLDPVRAFLVAGSLVSRVVLGLVASSGVGPCASSGPYPSSGSEEARSAAMARRSLRSSGVLVVVGGVMVACVLVRSCGCSFVRSYVFVSDRDVFNIYFILFFCSSAGFL